MKLIKYKTSMAYETLLGRYLSVYCWSFIELPFVNNDPPEVRITRPEDGQRFEWESLVRYAMNVKDKEDGISDYNEILPEEY